MTVFLMNQSVSYRMEANRKLQVSVFAIWWKPQVLYPPALGTLQITYSEVNENMKSEVGPLSIVMSSLKISSRQIPKIK